MQEEKLVDVQFVASKLDVNPRTVLRMVERGELPAIKIAHRLRFRPTDLDTYLRTRLASPSISPMPRADARSSHPTFSQGEWTDPEEDAPLSIADGQTRPHATPHTRNTIHTTGAQGTRPSKEALQLEIEQQRLEIAREKLALQAQFLALHRKHMDHALETANKAISLLPPEADPQIKSTLLQSLLPRLFLPDYASGLESLTRAGNANETRV